MYENTYPSITNYELESSNAYDRQKISVINFFKVVLKKLVELKSPLKDYPFSFNERLKEALLIEGRVLEFSFNSDWISKENQTFLLIYFYIERGGKIQINFSTIGNGFKPKDRTWKDILEKDYPNLGEIYQKYVSPALFTIALEELSQLLQDLVARKKELLEKFYW